MYIPFTKGHCIGNDFILIHEQYLSYLTKQTIITIANQHIGLGCDQLIIYNDEDQPAMRVYNADATVALACGNGTICLSYLLHVLQQRVNFKIKFGQRLLDCRIEDENAVINMGIASFAAPWMPTVTELKALLAQHNLICDQACTVDIGNKHLILINPQLEFEHYAVLARRLTMHDSLNKVNVNFATIKDGNIELRVWERGVGMTLACGSGACASFAAASGFGLIEGRTAVNFAIGSLHLAFAEQDIMMKGRGQIVAEGRYLL